MVVATSSKAPTWHAVGRDTLWIVDTSFLMQPQAVHALERDIVPFLTERGSNLTVPLVVMKELAKKATAPETKDLAETGSKVVASLRGRGLAKIIGSDREGNFADEIILAAATRYRTQRDIVLLTHDQDLAGDVRNLRQQRSVKSRHKIFVLAAGKDGAVFHTKGRQLPNRPIPQQTARATPTRPTTARGSPRKFRIAQAAETSPDTPISFDSAPVPGQEVLIGATRQYLGDQLAGAEGAEGAIYSVAGSDLVAKIYFPEKMTRHRYEKLCRIVQFGPQVERVMWPTDLVATTGGSPCGYVMDRSAGEPVATAIFIPVLLKRNHAGWDRRNLIDIAISISASVADLHSINVVVGDLNQKNLLVDTGGTRVNFVDSDSFQIEEYPCPVGSVNFLHPRLQGTDLSTVLRRETDDEFALATMIFMILMPGKSPFSQQGGGDPQLNVRDRKFPYSVKGITAGSSPPLGPWRMVWSHFPYRLKEAFHGVFVDDKRIRAREWTDILTEYRNHVDLGHHTAEIFPSTYKGVSAYAAEKYGGSEAEPTLHQEYCENCGDPIIVHGRGKLKKSERHCAPCRARVGKTLKCRECSSNFLFSLQQQADYKDRSWTAPVRCQACRDERVIVTCRRCDSTFKVAPHAVSTTPIGPLCKQCMSSCGTSIRCRDCGSTFTYTYGEQQYFEANNLDQPVRCTPCRNRKRQQ